MSKQTLITHIIIFYFENYFAEYKTFSFWRTQSKNNLVHLCQESRVLIQFCKAEFVSLRDLF